MKWLKKPVRVEDFKHPMLDAILEHQGTTDDELFHLIYEDFIRIFEETVRWWISETAYDKACQWLRIYHKKIWMSIPDDRGIVSFKKILPLV